MNAEEMVAYAEETHRIAVDNHERVLAMYDLCFPPWRWPKWWRESRLVKEGMRETNRRREILRAEQLAPGSSFRWDDEDENEEIEIEAIA